MAGLRRAIASLREHTGDPQSDRAQLNGQQAVQLTKQCPWLVGTLLDGGRGDGTGPGLVIGTSATTVNHGLGRTPRGFIVLDASTSGAMPFRSTSQPANASQQINLQASSAVTVKLWVW